MIINIKVPSPGESISEVEIANWSVTSGGQVLIDQEIGEIESDKATLAIVAEASGQLSILVPAGETVKVGQVIATIDSSKVVKDATISTSEEVVGLNNKMNRGYIPVIPGKTEDLSKVKITPIAQLMMDENNLSVEDVVNGLRRLGKKDILEVISRSAISLSIQQDSALAASRESKRIKMSSLRKKLSKRLVAVKNEMAMLTTFNELDMSSVIDIRAKYQKQFVEKHGIKLGFMSFFTKAVTEALLLHPTVNSIIDGDEIVTPEFCDIGVAVQTDKGLMVPIVRNTERMGLAEIEIRIMELAEKARSGKISLEDMAGGTFTISNGGIFGSMLSTPILNPPQSAILGMHNIVDRPVAINGRVEIRPMMFLALSYDHRIIDGKDSVGFLKKVKEMLEMPEKMLLGNQDIEKLLLGL